MIDWINMILIPYVDKVTGQLPEPTDKVYLVMDNCGIHKSVNVKPHWGKIPRVEIIWLPPHTSHFLQMLDAALFGVLKTQKPPDTKYKSQNRGKDISSISRPVGRCIPDHSDGLLPNERFPI